MKRMLIAVTLMLPTTVYAEDNSAYTIVFLLFFWYVFLIIGMIVFLAKTKIDALRIYFVLLGFIVLPVVAWHFALTGPTSAWKEAAQIVCVVLAPVVGAVAGYFLTGLKRKW